MKISPLYYKTRKTSRPAFAKILQKYQVTKARKPSYDYTCKNLASREWLKPSQISLGKIKQLRKTLTHRKKKLQKPCNIITHKLGKLADSHLQKPCKLRWLKPSQIKLKIM